MWLKRLGAIALIIVLCSLIFTSIYIFQLKNEKLIFISNDYQKGLGDRNVVARLKKTFKAAGVKALDLSTFRLISIFFSKNDAVKFFTIIQNDNCNARILDNPIQEVTYWTYPNVKTTLREKISVFLVHSVQDLLNSVGV